MMKRLMWRPKHVHSSRIVTIKGTLRRSKSAHPTWMVTSRIVMLKGPMFAEKTTELIRRRRKQEIANSKKNPKAKTLLVKYAKDQRYGEGDDLCTRNGTREKGVVAATTLREIEHLVAGVGHIYIDEGQFFEDLAEYVVRWAREGREVTVTALNAYGNYPLHSPWPQVQLLEPWAEVVNLYAICFVCGGTATRTQALKQTGAPTTEIGDADKYEARCLMCYES